MTNILLYLFLGLVAGMFSGLIGIGGGTIIVPVLVFLFGLSQHQAQGTTLALLVPPIGLLATWASLDAPSGLWQDIGPSGTEELSTRSRVLLPDIELQPVPFQIKYCKSGDSNGGLGCSHRCDSNALVTSKEATKRD